MHLLYYTRPNGIRHYHRTRLSNLQSFVNEQAAITCGIGHDLSQPAGPSRQSRSGVVARHHRQIVRGINPEEESTARAAQNNLPGKICRSVLRSQVLIDK